MIIFSAGVLSFGGCPGRNRPAGNANQETVGSDEKVALEGNVSSSIAGSVFVLSNPASMYNPSDSGRGSGMSSGIQGPVERRVYKMAARKARALGKRGPVVDPRLATFASDFARLPREAQNSDSVLAFLNSGRGLVEPAPLILMVSANDATGEASIGVLKKRLSSILASRRFAGMGAAFIQVEGVGYRLVVVFQESYVSTDPIPRKIDCGARVEFDARIDDGFKKPSLFVTLPDGETWHQVLRLRGKGRVRIPLTLDKGPGRYQVELLAEGSAGPTVLANFPVFCGLDPPSSIQLPERKEEKKTEKPGSESPGDIETWLFDMTNRERSKAGLRLLKRKRTLVLLARNHSAEMCRTGRFGHYSPDTGSAADRLREAGYRPQKVGENVAQARSKEAAHSALMGSPSHRANILNPKLTHVGIGVVVCETDAGSIQLFVTQKFMLP